MLSQEAFLESIDSVGCSGIVLSPEQRAALQSSLVMLQEHNKFQRIYLWGRICGVTDDYFIAYGSGKNEFGKDKKYFYVKTREEKELLMRWKLLNAPTDEARQKMKSISGRFTGDPSHDYEYTETVKVQQGEETIEEEHTVTLKEEDRLAVTVEAINKDALIVPIGSFIKTPVGHVYRNRSWEGLSIVEASKLSSYCHFRDAFNLLLKDPIQRANMDKATHFMDCVEDDVPKGKWSLQFERGSAMVVLKSLEWMGFVFYHIPGCSRFGSLYWGTGERNMDLPFML